MRVRKAVFPAAGWGTRFLPATKAQPKEMLPLVDKPVIQYAVEEAVAAGHRAGHHRHQQPEAGHRGPLRPQLRAGAPARVEGRHRDAPARPQDRRHGPDQLRAPEGAAGPRARRADGQGARRPRAVRGHPVRRRRDRRAPLRRPARRRLPAHRRLGGRGHAGAARGDRAATASSTPIPSGAPTTSGCTASAASSRSPSPDSAPSDLAIIGRYVLTPKIFEKLEQTQAVPAARSSSPTRSRRSWRSRTSSPTRSRARATTRAPRWAG